MKDTILTISLFLISFALLAQKPNINYATPQVFTVGNVLVPLAPINTGGAVSSSGGSVSTIAGSTTSGLANGIGVAARFNQPTSVIVDKSGIIYVADKYNHLIRKISVTGEVSTFAGSGAIGSADGQGTSASFYYPTAIVLDLSGNLYVSDQYNQKIRKITKDGLVSTFVGNGTIGSTDGIATTASFYNPEGLAIDSTGTIYVADLYNHKIRKVSPTGVVTTLAGTGNIGSSDGVGTSATFYYPSGLVIDATGSLFVVDHWNYKIRKVSAAGVVSTFAGNGSAGSTDGTALNASFNYPYGIAMDHSGNLYVADRNNNKIRKITKEGMVSTLAGDGVSGTTDGSAATARFNNPFGIAFDGIGNLIIADRNNNEIRKYTTVSYSINPALPAGLNFDVLTGIISGTPQIAQGSSTYQIMAKNEQGIDTTLLTISILSKPNIATFEITSVTPTSANGNGNLVNLGYPNPSSYGFCWNKTGNPTLSDMVVKKDTATAIGPFTLSISSLTPATKYYVKAFATNESGTSYGNEITFTTPDIAPKIAYVSPQKFTMGVAITPLLPVNTGGSVTNNSTTVSTIAGKTTYGFVNGVGSAASFYYPSGVALDKSGTIFVTDKYNHVIRKISPTGEVSTFAGSGSIGSTDGQGTSASFYYPSALTIDANGNLFVSDQYNHKIRKITKTGLVSTIAGVGYEASSDGPAASAGFYRPEGIVLDATGNIYVADYNNNKIRKITPAGVVSTLAGSGSQGSTDGTGTSASFYLPISLTIDAAGTLYVADQYNHKIRRVTSAGVVTTVAGTGVAGSTDGTASVATFNYPSGVLLDATGNLLVADKNSNKIRKISPSGLVSTIAGSETSGSADGNSATARFYNPQGLAMDSIGNLIVADRFNHEIRKIVASAYSIQPTLPAGLNFNVQTGEISGTPQISQPNTTYQISARNDQGVDITTISITILGKPSISTGDVTAIKTTSASVGVNILNLGAPNPSSFGICWNLIGNPSINDSLSKKDSVIVAGASTFNMTSLKLNTTYYVRAFVKNEFGIGYGNEVSFKTLDNAPAISYSGSQTYNEGVAITPLLPTNTGGTISNTLPMVSTIAGSTTYGFVNGKDSVSRFYYPTGVAVDKSGNIFVTDKYNHVIRKITPEGMVSTFAGAGYIGSSNGQGTAASFYYPGAVVIDKDENLYVSDQLNMKIRKITKAGLVTTYAGNGVESSDDGAALSSSFRRPEGLVLDTAGNLYVAEFWGHKIRKISPAGVVSTLAGTGAQGSTDGPGTSATFNYPCGLTIDATGTLYVADQWSNKIRKVTASGVVSTIAGTGAIGSADGPGSSATFNYPSAVLLDASGNILVADRSSNKIRKITSDGIVSTLVGNETAGSADGNYDVARFNFPFAMAFDLNRNLIVADRYNHEIRKIAVSAYSINPALPEGLSFNNLTGAISGTPLRGSETKTYTITAANETGVSTASLILSINGKSSITTDMVGTIAATTAVINGTLTSLGFPNPTAFGFCWNKKGAPTVQDSSSIMTLPAVAGSYTYIIKNLIPGDTYFVRAYATNTYGTVYGVERSFTTPISAPNLTYLSPQAYVVGSPIKPLIPVNSGGKPVPFPYVYTFAGSGADEIIDGAALAAGISGPSGIAMDSDGNMYVTQPGRNIVRKISTQGVVTTLAGSMNGESGSADGVGTAARFFEPSGIAVDNKGNLYVSDANNHKIRKISKQGMVTTLAGSGTAGRTNGKGATAHFNFPMGLAVDTAGNVYVADKGNKRICKITPDGVVTTLAVNEPVSNSDDVGGTFADFSEPTGIAIDSTGKILIVDYSRCVIYKYLPNGSISILAGNGSSGQSFSSPMGIALDTQGNAYVTEYGGCKIRKITSEGVVTTFAGSGAYSGYLDGKASTALFSNPSGIVLDKNGIAYVADMSNSRIRKIGTANYTISPTLPLGLELDYMTGTISGTPKVINRVATFTITSNNTGGVNNATVDISTISKPDALDYLNGAKLSVYPNPASSQICVKGLTESQMLTIYSLTGVKLLSQEVSNGTIVDVSSLASGVYLVKVGGKELKLFKK